jgi:integration host factor subunit beta
MNKSELIEAVAEQEGLSRKTAEGVVNTFFDAIADGLAEGERAEIRGLGSFKVKEYEGYTGRNPKTGRSVEVKPKRLPFFRVGKDLKERVDDLASDSE